MARLIKNGMPAFAGMTDVLRMKFSKSTVTPAKAGVSFLYKNMGCQPEFTPDSDPGRA